MTLGSFVLFWGAISVGYVLASTIIGSIFGVSIWIVEASEENVRRTTEENIRRNRGYLPRYKDTHKDELLEKGEESPPKYEDVNRDLPSYEEAIEENDLVSKVDTANANRRSQSKNK